MIVAGIDPSLTSTGIAVLLDGAPLALHKIGHPSQEAKSYANRSDRIVSQCRAVIDALFDAIPGYPRVTIASRDNTAITYVAPNIDLALIEGPAYAHANAYTHDGAGLWWGLYAALRARKIPTAVIAPPTLKTWTTGRGNAEKGLILTTVRHWWPGLAIANHDQADALALATIGAAHAGDPLPFELKDRHHKTLQAIDWPKVAA